MKEDLRGVFYVTRGTYKKGVAPSFMNSVTGTQHWIGGYNPETSDEEWYVLHDNITFTAQRAGSDLEHVLKGVYDLIKHYKTLDNYLKITKGLPIPHSPSMVELDKKVFNTYGDYYQYEVEELEDLAYKELREDTPIHRARKKLRKRTNTSVEITQTDTPIIETGTPKKTLKTKKGLKPIKRNTKVELI